MIAGSSSEVLKSAGTKLTAFWLAVLLCHYAPSVAASDRGVAQQALIAEALAHEHGEGVPRNFQRAAELYCKAAGQGNAEAQFSLGWMYANGRGVTRDDDLAAGLFGLAAAQGHEPAKRMQRYVGEASNNLPKCLNELDEAIYGVSARDEALFTATPERKRIFDLVRDLAPEYKVSPRLALAVISVESNFNVRARSPKDAQGLMQLIPETSARFNVRNAYDPIQNLRGGLAYLRWLLAYYRGNVALVAAGYNAGEKAVDRYRGIPPYEETRNYVKRILKLFRLEEHPYDDTITDVSPALQMASIRQ
jgi:sulfur relay (sulfurtransferase) DsrC/TusE family protein